MIRYCDGFPLCVAAFLAASLAVSHPGRAQTSPESDLKANVALGAEAFARGGLNEAILYWTGALDAASKLEDPAGRISILTRRAEAYQVLGYLEKSITDLEGAIGLAETQEADDALPRLRGRLGSVYALAGKRKAAQAEFDATLSYAKTRGDRLLEATTLNNLGNLLFERKLYTEAAEAYQRSGVLAAAVGQPELWWTARVNAAYAQNAEGSGETALRSLQEALDGVKAVPATSGTANGLISAARLLLRLEARARQSRPDLHRLAYLALSSALDMASRIGDERAECYALGYMAQLYERSGRLDEALRLTRRALFCAQALGAPEALYLWQWQVGRIMWAQGDLQAAVEAYKASVVTLRSIRADMVVSLSGGQSSFQDSIRPVILGLADLLLQASETIEDRSQQQAMLAEARSTVELLKAAELEDYFHDNCVAALRAKERKIDKIAPRTAALYPILLDDRVELLLSLPGGLSRITVPVPEERLRPVIVRFRRLLEKRTTRQYLAPSQQLYAWLIEPIEAQLAENEIATLVVVPGGLLNSISFAALHDGERHLIEKMAVAVAPGLTLIEPRPVAREPAVVLAGGLSEPVQEFSALPYVESELRALQNLFAGTLLENEQFLLQSVSRELEVTPYSVVHIASHAQFEPDARDSFLLTYDGRLTMDGLERFVKLSRFREDPVDLLTLSACSTAAGDERAALGLAGIGIKAGARSALASLWFINDRSTAILISRFYEELKKPVNTKAEALRRAQLALMEIYRFRHPGYWAPFLMIGSWL
ncbi:MAG: CHAT domain-containing protein [Kiloniellaceae bacterium]